MNDFSFLAIAYLSPELSEFYELISWPFPNTKCTERIRVLFRYTHIKPEVDGRRKKNSSWTRRGEKKRGQEIRWENKKNFATVNRLQVTACACMRKTSQMHVRDRLMQVRRGFSWWKGQTCERISGLEVCKYNESSLSSSRESERKALRLQSRGEEKERTVTGGGGIIGPNGSACWRRLMQ